MSTWYVINHNDLYRIIDVTAYMLYTYNSYDVMYLIVGNIANAWNVLYIVTAWEYSVTLWYVLLICN